MKKVLALLFAACVVWAGVVPASNIDRAKIDDGATAPDLPHLPNLRASSPIDSSANGFSMWTQMQECIAYNPAIGGLEFVCRNYALSGDLDVCQSDNLFTFAVVDVSAYAQSLGAARYPTAVASDDGSANGPHITFPVLVAGQWGLMGAQYASAGWWSSFWDAAVDVGGGDVNTHKVIGKQLADGNICVVGASDVDEVFYRTYSADLSTQLGSGTIATGVDYIGFDVNGGIAAVMYWDASLNVFYKTSTDGITWSSETPYAITYPNPYSNNTLYWKQMALTDAGTPVFVFDVMDGDDGTYPWSGHVYASVGSGSTPVDVGDPAKSTCWHPTVATGGGCIVVLYQSVNAAGGLDTLARFDIYSNISMDNGSTWLGPIAVETGGRVGLAQIAKRINTTDHCFYYAYGMNCVEDVDPTYDVGWGNGAYQYRWYWGSAPVGIEEGNTTRPGKTVLYATPNPVRNTSHIEYTVAASGTVELRLFGVDGRLVKVVDSGYRAAGTYTANLNASQLANGTYLLVLEQGTQTASRTIVIAR